MRRACPCVFCRSDALRGRRQYIARWSDEELYHDGALCPGGPREQAVLFGPRHAATFGIRGNGPVRLVPLLVKGAYRDSLTIRRVRALGLVS
jgi:hypothetical protein